MSGDGAGLGAGVLGRLGRRHGTPLLIVDCAVVRRQYRALAAALPGVELHYALKPLPFAPVVATLRDLGARFDVATRGEIRLVRAQREGRWWYYLDDGMYGSFSGQLYDHAVYPVDCPERRGPRLPSVLAGPTCDSIDVIHEDLPLPELQIGDRLVGRMMGAYTASSATDFNFIPRAKLVAVNQRRKAARAD